MVASIAIMHKERYEDASSSQERNIRSDIKIRKLGAELKEAGQVRKDELAKDEKDRGAGGATDEAEQEGGGEATRRRKVRNIVTGAPKKVRCERRTPNHG